MDWTVSDADDKTESNAATQNLTLLLDIIMTLWPCSKPQLRTRFNLICLCSWMKGIISRQQEGADQYGLHGRVQLYVLLISDATSALWHCDYFNGYFILIMHFIGVRHFSYSNILWIKFDSYYNVLKWSHHSLSAFLSIGWNYLQSKWMIL